MEGLFDKRLLVVTGKGGVGKTTVAAALGLAAARAGKRTVVAEVSARDDISRVLSGASANVFEERLVADGLHHVSIDPEHAMEEYLEDQLPSRALADVLARSRIFSYLAAATPGLRELLTVGKVWELAQDERRTPGAKPYDLVVLDAPATGHGVAILTAPKTFSDAAHVGPVARQGRKIHDTLADPALTGVVAVTLAEEMPVNETLHLGQEVKEKIGLPLSLIVANAMLPDRLSAADSRQLEGHPHPAVRTALSHHARAKTQKAQLSRLRRGTKDPVRTLPLLFRDRLQLDDLATLSRHFK